MEVLSDAEDILLEALAAHGSSTDSISIIDDTDLDPDFEISTNKKEKEKRSRKRKRRSAKGVRAIFDVSDSDSDVELPKRKEKKKSKPVPKITKQKKKHNSSKDTRPIVPGEDDHAEVFVYQNEYMVAYAKEYYEDRRHIELMEYMTMMDEIIDTRHTQAIQACESECFAYLADVLRAEEEYVMAYEVQYGQLMRPIQGEDMHELVLSQERSYLMTYRHEFEERKKQRSAKKQPKPETWKKNTRKHDKNHGNAYVSSRGKLVFAKKVKHGCNICKKECQMKINNECRQKIFKSFWELGDVDSQREFISRTVRQVECKRSKKNSRKQSSFSYSFFIDKIQIDVCKKFYLDTLDIGQALVYGALKKVDSVGNIKKDQRGLHKSRKRLSFEAQDFIEDHIKSFPTVPSHYCRKSSTKQYLSNELNINIMYRLYIEKCKASMVKPESREAYSNVFHTQNLAFLMPKKDRCDFCVGYENKREHTQNEIMEYNVHMKRKTLAREGWKDATQKLAMEKKDEINSACFDLQQVLHCPHGQASEFYYKRKLGVFNLSVYDMASSEAYCYMWPEHITSRGPNEIASCVLSYIKTKVNEGQSIVFLTSDNCPGQNKNKPFACMLWHAINSLSGLKKIEYGFLEKGHTQNENDTVHSVITNSVKKVTLYTPEQWFHGVRMARTKPKPFNVKEMCLEDFFDFKNVAKSIKNFRLADDGSEVDWTILRHICVTKEDPNALLIKTEHDGPAVRVDLMRRKRRSNTPGENIPLLNLTNVCGIPKAKKDDLLSLCETNLIPPPYQTYFQNIPLGQDNVEISDED